MTDNPLRTMRQRLELDRQLEGNRTRPQAPAHPHKPYAEQRPVPVDLWLKCTACGQIVVREAFENQGSVCPYCQHHYRLDAPTRLRLICDAGSFSAWDMQLTSVNPLGFSGYSQKIQQLQQQTGLTEAILTGQATIGGKPCAIGVMDSRFMMGSMGSVVGEKVTRLFERAADAGWPVVLFVASGGARMQEGILSLMQMAKTAQAVARFQKSGQLSLAVLTDPTTGGVTASFASLANITLAEPGALIGFAGRRVIEGTLTEQLPEGFQQAEFLLAHGFVDRIVQRADLRQTVAWLLDLHHRQGLPPGLKGTQAPGDQAPQAASPLPASARLDIIRHKDRPVLTDYLPLVFDEVLELHGDRAFGDDAALWCGLARLAGQPVTLIGHRKGKSLQENVSCRFGMPHPEGYRKAIRLMKEAERFNRPLVTFIDTPGAYCGTAAEERGQGSAIAQSLLTLVGLKVPVISLVTGEGGSGGALAIGVGDRLAMLSNALYSVISPRGFASLLWKDPSRELEAADAMKITAEALQALGVCDHILLEPGQGAHTNLPAMAETIKVFLVQTLADLMARDRADLLQERASRLRSFGCFDG